MRHKSGYIGLLSLLITTAVIVFLAWRTFKGPVSENKVNQVSSGVSSIKEAENIKQIIQNNSAETAKEIP
jgi:hypothetical protein